ncbi:MAG: 4-(cytidine 5'-diphospho)-2-C-methyl-D-erythritol kinase [Coprobacter fastidiosus]|jgi:4-(cytidine 5'-diphospho)-2-C-methyl-D-erythritol kinase
MIIFPNAKINLGLNIVAKRPDNYHNLETIFYPIPLEDALEVVDLPGKTDACLHISGLQIDGEPNKNLIIRAYDLLKASFDLPAVDIYLHKVIPFGAGLGGGSSDAAFMLRLLKDKYKLPVSEEMLLSLAARLGADCPFFLLNRPVLATGIGNEFTPVSLTLKNYYLVLVKPDIMIPTAKAYSLVKPEQPKVPLSEIVKKPVEEWKNLMTNDFEKSVFSHYPEIAEIKSRLYDIGAVYASMSGSGSSVYGLFSNLPELPDDLFPGSFVWQGECRY